MHQNAFSRLAHRSRADAPAATQSSPSVPLTPRRATYVDVLEGALRIGSMSAALHRGLLLEALRPPECPERNPLNDE